MGIKVMEETHEKKVVKREYGKQKTKRVNRSNNGGSIGVVYKLGETFI